MLENGADINGKNKDELTPIMHMVEMWKGSFHQGFKTHGKILYYLIEKGADIHHTTCNGESLLSLCKECNQDGFYDYVIEDLENKDNAMNKSEDKEEIVSNKSE